MLDFRDCLLDISHLLLLGGNSNSPLGLCFRMLTACFPQGPGRAASDKVGDRTDEGLSTHLSLGLVPYTPYFLTL